MNPRRGLVVGVGGQTGSATNGLRFCGYIGRECRGRREKRKEKTRLREEGWKEVMEDYQLHRRGRCVEESLGRVGNTKETDSGGRALMRRFDQRGKVADGGFEGGRVASRWSGCEILDTPTLIAYSNFEAEQSKREISALNQLRLYSQNYSPI